MEIRDTVCLEGAFFPLTATGATDSPAGHVRSARADAHETGTL